MEEKKPSQEIKTDNEENKKIIEEVEKIRKREKFLKIISIILLLTIIISFTIVYVLYNNYRKVSQTMEEVVNKIEQEIDTNKHIEELKQNTQIITSSISFESTSLSKIGGLSKDIIETASKSENIKNVEEIVDDYYNDPAINQFIEKFKNDPEMKEIFELPPKERPIKMFKKMNDPKFMQKITKEFLSNPELMKSFIKMGTDPRIQNIMKNISNKDNVLKVPIESKNKQISQ
ncbi:MAG: hypothetical protein N2Z20_05625 [Elusimicrobiales bacterium]|nr:hypothetical protein [Elusimicrobiales bacterium]